jgi:hypothetical protein
MYKYKPFWTKELTNQRNTRDQAQGIAEKSKNRRDIINWKRECAIMKKQISLSKKEIWNKFISGIDYTSIQTTQQAE